MRCPECYRYTLEDNCPTCSTSTLSPLPPRYSPEDHYGHYRRALQRQQRRRAEEQTPPASGSGSQVDNPTLTDTGSEAF